MQNPFKKPKRGPTPDALPIQERNEWIERRGAFDFQLWSAKEELNKVKAALTTASIAVLKDPTEEHVKAEVALTEQRQELIERIEKLNHHIGICGEQIAALEDQANIIAHKRQINAANRALDDRDEIAPAFTEALRVVLGTMSRLREANDTAYSAKPQWGNETDNNLGLSPSSFEWKLAHEIWRVSEQLGVKWPEAARDNSIDRKLTFEARLKRETVHVMERLGARPIVYNRWLFSDTDTDQQETPAMTVKPATAEA